jgi:putative transposase
VLVDAFINERVLRLEKTRDKHSGVGKPKTLDADSIDSPSQPRDVWRATSAAPLEAIQANVLDRQFAPKHPGAVWTADITYLPTAEGWLYLAVVIDLYSRRVVGWAVRPSLAKELTTSALKSAIEHQRPNPGLLHHSDRGSQYTSFEYQSMLRREGITISMSRSGSCHDNAPTESFFGTLKTEMFLRGDPFYSHDEARRAIFEYIEVFYNRQRRHSTLNYMTPVEYEKHYIEQHSSAT